MIIEANVIYALIMKSQGSTTWSDLTGKTRASPISWCLISLSGTLHFYIALKYINLMDELWTVFHISASKVKSFFVFSRSWWLDPNVAGIMMALILYKVMRTDIASTLRGVRFLFSAFSRSFVLTQFPYLIVWQLVCYIISSPIRPWWAERISYCTIPFFIYARGTLLHT